jgi:hypothetical protein
MVRKATGRPVGQPPHRPTKDSRTRVLLWVSAGATQDFIAREMGMALNTLRAHYKRELQEGRDEIINRVGRGVIARAMNGDNACSFFYLRTQGGDRWRERTRVEATGLNGGPIDVRHLTTEQIIAAIAALREDTGSH